MNRRDVLKLGAAATVGAALSGCNRLIASVGRTKPNPALPSGDTSPEVRILNRLGFGARPGDIARVAGMGVAAYVEAQLSATEPEDVRLQLLLSRLDILRMDGEELQDLPRPEMVRQLQQAALLRAVYGKNQLQERLADFWINHFNVYALKSEGPYRLATDTGDVVRKNALGKFPDMVRASAHSPAMLGYLDNTVNKSGVANENYARELMELHTLGVHGGYTQQDVMEVARCFTGWTVETGFLKPRGKFRFDPDAHDQGAKKVLGHTIPASGGQQDGDRVLTILVEHPSTARFISTKLCHEFLGHEDPGWIDRMSQTYLATGGDIREMLRPLLQSEDLLKAPPISKRPLDFVASSLRALDAETDCGKPVVEHLANMGQGLYLWPMPDGYPTKPTAWSGSMLGRWNFAYDLSSSRLPGTQVDLKTLGHPVEMVYGRRPSRHDLVSHLIANRDQAEAFALCLASPEFQWR
ncbi:MAG: hypothetical protein QOJ65_376 [Fimbriimonadaceae bacterium]|jgi:uncharacterized protein (DUF1800 family)|nr:hypothetical protein [Fimbriimonadaceae bacterium]